MSTFARSRPRLLSCLLGVAVVAGTGVAAALPPAAAAASTVTHSATVGQTAVAYASQEAGKPYLWGGSGPDSFDCSGLVQFVYNRLGVSLPRTAQQQYGAMPQVPQNEAQPGDVLFFYDATGAIYHDAIYAGGNQMWTAPKTGQNVQLQGIWSSAYFVGDPTGLSPIPNGSGATGTLPYGDIGARWTATGGAAGYLGAPLGAERSVAAGRAQDFAGGTIYWTPSTGAHAVHGAILGDYLATGGPAGPLGFPVTDETGTPDGIGRFNHFANAASIYWTPKTGAHAIYGAIRAAWAASGWEAGPTGYPTTDETGTADGVARYNDFSRNGSVYWTPATGAHVIYGAIRVAWLASGGGAGPAGYPTTDEQASATGTGRFNSFSRGGAIYWSATTGAHLVYGAIGAAWLGAGADRSGLGFPTSDEHAASGGRQSDFQRGSLFWSTSTGRLAVR